MAERNSNITKKNVLLKLIIGGALVVAMIVGIAFIRSNGRGSETVKSGHILSINDIQADPDAYKGTITITGVVAGRHRSDPTVFALIETSEAKICKQTGCASFYLPVRYEGEFPQVWDEVNVTGSFTEGVLLLQATKVDLLRHLTL